MAITSAASGTQTCTINTEHTLAELTTVGVYVLVLDTTNMVAGDTLELRVYTKNQSGKSLVVAYGPLYFVGAQAEPQKYTIPVPVDTDIKFTIKQTAGTGRAFDWNLLKL